MIVIKKKLLLILIYSWREILTKMKLNATHEFLRFLVVSSRQAVLQIESIYLKKSFVTGNFTRFKYLVKFLSTSVRTVNNSQEGVYLLFTREEAKPVAMLIYTLDITLIIRLSRIVRCLDYLYSPSPTQWFTAFCLGVSVWFFFLSILFCF